nr:TPA_asm: m73.6 sORF 1 [Murid betaherpesvirus 1]DBA07826.1 TPA_asm: m73.6 sORF 1 [Murid betaherpesvirus 1]
MRIAMITKATTTE